MKKLITLSIFALVLVALAPAALNANEITVTIDGIAVDFDGQSPVIIDGRTLVPLRGVFELLGFTVDWHQDTQAAHLLRAEDIIIVTIDSYVFTVNSNKVALDAPAQIINDRTMLPIRAVLESVGYRVEWHESTSTVLINRIYTVQAGDTLWSIATRTLGDGSRYPEILTANNLDINFTFSLGQQLIIPIFEPQTTETDSNVIVSFSQRDPRWADHMFGSFTMAEGGCGPTSVAMIVSTLHGTEVLPDYVATWGSRFYVEGIGASHALFTSPAMHEHFNLEYQAISIHNDEEILEALHSGAMIITSVQSTQSPNAKSGNQGIFNPQGLGGHIAVVHGVTPEGNVLVTSPRIDLSEYTEGWSLDVVRQELHSGIGIFWTFTANVN
ncbi:MAG: stalk domain-containing protein [Defluviitaleaceae bacterium]|nr:stalk domain-containing protein [Defluviitaleaceae bacterium]